MGEEPGAAPRGAPDVLCTGRRCGCIPGSDARDHQRRWIDESFTAANSRMMPRRPVTLRAAVSFRSHTISHTRRPSSLLRRLARPRSYKEAWVAGDSQTPWYLSPSPRHATAAALSSPVHCTWASIVPTAVKHTERGPSRPCCKLVDESSRGRARPRNGSEGFYTPYIMYSTSPCTRPIAWACRKSCSLFVVRTHHTGLSYCTSGFTVRVMSTTVYAFELHTHVQKK